VTEQRIVIDTDGTLHFVWDDALASLVEASEAVVTRASHVEPSSTKPGWWEADMAPSDGPVLGPFRLRAEALQAEREWLREHRGL
jgi:hypothetical protein